MTVEVEEEQLREAGWHSMDECPPWEPSPLVAENLRRGTENAAGRLHRVLHGPIATDPAACNLEPCRSIPLDLLLIPMGRVR